MDDDKFYDDGADGYWAEQMRLRIGETVDEEAPALDTVVRTRAIDSMVEKVSGEWGDDGDGESPGAVPALTRVEEEFVRLGAFRARRWRDPAPKEPPRFRPCTDCRPLRSARRLRRHPTRTRAGPGSDDPDPEPPRNRLSSSALRRAAQ